jgi:phosphatidylserine/phosphatidylglycerophosphate/cardiolipin synthase-like enzyme
MTDAFAPLSTDELTAVAMALRAGRLSVPLSQLSVAPYLGRAAASVAPTLVKLTTEGLAAEHLAFFLEVLAAERNSQRDGDDVELVSTGPEAAGFPARDTRIVVRELFRQATKSVLIAGYAVYQGHDVFRVLAERMDAYPDLVVRMFLNVERPYGDTSKSSEILRRFAERFKAQEWPGSRLPEAYYDSRSLDLDASKRASLHAKCVVVDERIAFVSSANFTEAAEVRNIEVGALVPSEPFARQLASHFRALADRQVLVRVPGL